MLLDLRIYKMAKNATKEMPAAIKQMDKAIISLLPYREFRSVSQAVIALMQEKTKLQQQLEAAGEITKKKARLK